ncbi:MAG: response regulator transcription factor [Chloroflexi bacterium]|nr:response regulator transcription factor [Chloroflexota bacterium]
MVQAVSAGRRATATHDLDHWPEPGPFRQVRVLIAEPRGLVRDALRSLIEGTDPYSVVGEAGDLDAAVGMAAHLQPSIIVMNADLARSGLAQAMREFRLQSPTSKLLLIATDAWVEEACALVEQGGTGFVLTESTGAELLMALREVLEHDVYIAAGATRRLFSNGGRRDQSGHPRIMAGKGLLTARERELLRLISAGRPNREIAAELYISVRTVEAHKARMISRLGLRNTTELMRYAVQSSREGVPN